MKITLHNADRHNVQLNFVEIERGVNTRGYLTLADGPSMNRLYSFLSKRIARGEMVRVPNRVNKTVTYREV